jgi:chitinase
LTLTVTDDDGATDADDVNITVTGTNTAPVAVITKPLANTTYYCYEGSSPSIVLDGSESSDKDGDALTYAWSGTVGINTVSINSLINDRTNKVTSITRDDLCNFVGNVDNDVNCSSTGDVASLAKTQHTEGSNNIAIYDPGTDGGCTVTIDLNVSDGSASGSDKAKVNIRIHFPT